MSSTPTTAAHFRTCALAKNAVLFLVLGAAMVFLPALALFLGSQSPPAGLSDA